MSSKLKSAIQYAIIVLIGVFFLYYVFRDTNWADLFTKLKKANLNWLAAGMVVALISHWLRAYRATLLYQAIGFKVSSIDSFYGVLIGYMMNYVIPRAGEVSRCAALVKTSGMPIEKSFGTVVTERIVDMVILLLILGAIFLIQFEQLVDFIKSNSNSNNVTSGSFPWKWIVIALVILTSVLLYAIRKKLMKSPLFAKLFTIIQGFSDGLLSIRHVKKPFLFILLSVLIWIGYIFMMYLCLFAFETTSYLTFIDCLTVFAIGTIGVVLPAPGAGAGTYHFFVMSALLIFGVPKEDGIAYATMVHGSQMILLLFLGAIASLLVLIKQKKLGYDE